MANDIPLKVGNLSGKLTNCAPSVHAALASPDLRDGSVYECPPQLHVSLEVALATGRPLLIRGKPGTGKSSFAAYVARNFNWRYYEHSVTSATQLQDLLWRFDAVRRLADAQARRTDSDKPLNDFDYIEPGPLWWAFDRSSAFARGYDSSKAGAGSMPKLAAEPRESINNERDQRRAVVLIDEIDKADPDIPNALLVPLGSLRFQVSELGVEIARVAPTGGQLPRETKTNGLLVVITTNEERELPEAFVRRCITVRLEQPEKGPLLNIARMHFGTDGKVLTASQEEVADTLADLFFKLRDAAGAKGQRVPGTAEYLDALRACYALDIEPSETDATWPVLQDVALAKEQPAQQ